jgi:hypothetical protein
MVGVAFFKKEKSVVAQQTTAGQDPDDNSASQKNNKIFPIIKDIVIAFLMCACGSCCRASETLRVGSFFEAGLVSGNGQGRMMTKETLAIEVLQARCLVGQESSLDERRAQQTIEEARLGVVAIRRRQHPHVAVIVEIFHLLQYHFIYPTAIQQTIPKISAKLKSVCDFELLRHNNAKRQQHNKHNVPRSTLIS